MQICIGPLGWAEAILPYTGGYVVMEGTFIPNCMENQDTGR